MYHAITSHQTFVGGVTAAATLTLLYAVEGYLIGIFAGAPATPFVRLLGAWWGIWLIVGNLIVGYVLTLLYTVFGRGIYGSHGVRGLKYGAGIWLAATMFYPPLLYINVTLPAWLVLGWVCGSLVNLLIVGYIIGLLVDVRN